MKSEADINLQRTIVSTAFEEIADRFPRRQPKTKAELKANQSFNTSQMLAKLEQHKLEKQTLEEECRTRNQYLETMHR